MGKRKRKVFPKRKRSIFSRPNPMKRKLQLRRRKIKVYLHKHDPRVLIARGFRKVVDEIYTVPKKHIVNGVHKVVGGICNISNKVKDKIAENAMALDNPFSVQFYEDRCNIQ